MPGRIAATVSLASVAALALLAGACGSDSDEDAPGLANPASVYCAEQGGTESGPEPMCELPDGTVVDGWDFYRANNPEDS